MAIQRPAVFLLFGCVALTGCQERQTTVETEIYVAELEAYVAELEGELYHDRTQIAELSAALTNGMRDLELAIGDVDRRVLDLSGGVELQYVVPEVEAAVAITKQRLATVRATASELSRNVDGWRN